MLHERLDLSYPPKHPIRSHIWSHFYRPPCCGQPRRNKAAGRGPGSDAVAAAGVSWRRASGAPAADRLDAAADSSAPRTFAALATSPSRARTRATSTPAAAGRRRRLSSLSRSRRSRAALVWTLTEREEGGRKVQRCKNRNAEERIRNKKNSPHPLPRLGRRRGLLEAGDPRGHELEVPRADDCVRRVVPEEVGDQVPAPGDRRLDLAWEQETTRERECV